MIQATTFVQRRIQSLVLVLLAVLLATPLAQSAPKNEELEESYQVIAQAMALVRSESLENPTDVKLINSALDGMTLFLEDKKCKNQIFTHIDEDTSSQEAVKAFKKQFEEATKKYPKYLKDHSLTMAALSGVMKGTDDPYTVYLSPNDYKMLNETMSGGNFGGLGVVIALDPKDNNQLIVVSPMEDTPAFRAGLKSKDKIVKIDGVPTKGLTIKEASEKLRGEVGTKVTLTIKRTAADDAFDVVLTREQIHVKSVVSELLEQDGHKIGHVTLNIFGESTNLETEKALRDLENQGAEAFILDVRDNVGGYVSAAVDICSKFLPTGSRVVSIVERKRPEQVMYSRPNMRKQKPMVVLVNKSSASASEITAGAIKDLKRGKLIGTKTYGKGSVQKLYPVQFPGKEVSAFKITTAHYHTPLGHDIHKAGLEPDYVVELPEDVKNAPKIDAQVQKALDLLVADLTKGTKISSMSPSSVNNAIKIDGLADELTYIKNHFEKSGTYHVIERKLSTQNGMLLEKVRIKTKDGKIHTLLFDLSSCIGY